MSAVASDTSAQIAVYWPHSKKSVKVAEPPNVEVNLAIFSEAWIAALAVEERTSWLGLS